VQAAIGFQARTGWAALVAISGPRNKPVVVDRRRVELVDDDVPAHVFHAAQELELGDARALVRRAERTAARAAARAIRAVTGDLRKVGLDVVGMGLGVAPARTPSALEKVLASHALVHAAEGELYRDALTEAGERCRLPVATLPRKEIAACAAKELGVRSAHLDTELTRMGREVGAPWRQEQKEAALAAWVALGREASAA
jgi:hypothetical protein